MPQNQNLKNSYDNIKSQLKNEVPKDNKDNITPNKLTDQKNIEQKDESKTTNNNLVNNFAEKNKNSYNENTYNENKNEYTNSTEMDLFREALNAVLKFKSNIGIHEKEFKDSLDQLTLDDTYKQEIEDSKKRKKDFAPVKRYKKFFDEDLQNLIDFILDRSDEKFTISTSNYDKFTKFLDETVKKLQEDLDKKNDKGEPAIGNPLRSFIVKTIKALNSINDNNGFSFDPTKLVSDLSDVKTHMSDMRNNIPFSRRIIIAIYNFFTMTNFYQNVVEIENNLKSAIDDINSYYKCDLEQRPLLVTEIFDKIVKIEHLLKTIPFVSKKNIEILQSTKEALKKSLEARLDSNDIIVSFVKVFGKDAIKHVCDRKINNKKTYNHILSGITKYIKNDSNISNENKAKTIAKSLLDGQDIDDILIGEDEKEYLKDTFFYGKVKKEYDDIIDDMESTESYEDAKIKGNDNLRKIDAISKQTKKIVGSICDFVNVCNEDIEEFTKTCTVYDSLGGKTNKHFIDNNIVKMKERMINSIKTIISSYKDSFYEYIDSDLERKRVTEKAKKNFKKTKEEIQEAMQKKLFKNGKPKVGKESEVLEMQNILGNMKEPCDFSFTCYEQIKKLINNLEQQNKNSFKFKTIYPDNYYKNYKNGNIFTLANDKNKIENKILNNLFKNFRRDKDK